MKSLPVGANSAYWVANWIFDYTMLVAVMAMACVLLAILKPSTFGGSEMCVIFFVGLLAALACLFRFYLLSFLVTDVKMAQTLFFYGSLLSI